MPASTVISEIALIFVANDDFGTQVNKAIAIVGETFGVSRCGLFVDSEDGLTMTITHEWCAVGSESMADAFQQFPYARIPSWKKLLQDRDPCVIDDVRRLPKDVRSVLKAMNGRAVIVVPLLMDDAVNGFIGCIDSRRSRAWSDLEIEAMRVLGSMISSAYSKKRLAEKLSASEANFCSFFDTIDDMLLVSDRAGQIMFANKGACRKLGYSLTEIIGKHIIEIHPPDNRDDANRMLEAILSRQTSFCSLDIWTREKIRVPVETRIWFGQWNGSECIFGISRDISLEQAALQKFERLFHGNPAAMAVVSMKDRCFVEVNEALTEKLGYDREELIGRSGADLDLVVDEAFVSLVRDRLLREGQIRNRKIVLRRKDGLLIHGLFSGDIISILGKSYIIMVLIDITSQVELEDELTSERERLSNIIEGTRLGTWEWHIPSGKTVFNERWAGMLGCTLAELEPTNIDNWLRLVHPDDLVEARRLINLHFDGITDFYECEIRMRRKDGDWVWVLDRGKVIERDQDGRPTTMYGTHTDITEKKGMEERIRELAIRDSLTQVYNRRYISARLGEIVAEHVRSKRIFCVSMLDIDHFKVVNDTYGHQAGDFVLIEFARIIGQVIRQYDLFGRYGGEEFIIVSPGVGARKIIQLIERVMSVVRGKVFCFEGDDIKLTFSCGVADSSDFAGVDFSLDEIIALADRRLYAAKEAGRNCCIGP